MAGGRCLHVPTLLGRSRRLLGGVLAFAMMLASSSSLATPKVIITVDVESKPAFPLPKQVDAVCSDGAPCGLGEIVRMLRHRRLAGTFFLNVYEYRAWGEPAMRAVATGLQAAGQDVALHTHPQWAYDPSRNGMSQYSLAEQTEIIRDGVRLLTRWTDQAVVAHRAGDYASDERTLEALRSNGIRVDSSMFWGHSSSQLNESGIPRNLVSTPGGVLEIPVTVYLREERPRLFGHLFAPVTAIRKVDCDWLYSEDEARLAIDGLISADPQFIVIFLHSFSFLEEEADGGAPVANRRSQAIFRSLLDRAKERGLEVVTMRDVAASPTMVDVSKRDDILPQVTAQVALHRYLLHRWRSARTTEKSIAIASMVAIAVTAVWAVVSLLRWLAFAARGHSGRKPWVRS